MRFLLALALALTVANCSVGRLFFEGEILEPKDDGVSRVAIPGAHVRIEDNTTKNSNEGFSDETGFVNLEVVVTDDETHTFTVTVTKTGFQQTVEFLSGTRSTGISQRFFLPREE